MPPLTELRTSDFGLRISAARAGGFSLVELIGVLAIIAILAAAILPAVIRRIDLAAKAREITDLSSISNALALQILTRTNLLPNTNPSSWGKAAAEWLQLPISEVTTTRRGITRELYRDPGSGLFVGVQNQTVLGFPAAPPQARMILISTMAKPAPPGSAAIQFDNVWNTPDGSIPSTWTTWTGKGEDLIIQRMNLTPLFHRLVLVNRDPGSQPRYSIDSSSTAPVPQNGFDSYFLDGTVVGLCNSNGIPVERLVLTRDESLVFEGNKWGPYWYPTGSDEMLANEFAELAQAFMNTNYPSSSHMGADQQGTIVSMFNFMVVYTFWSKCDSVEGHFPKRGITGQGTTVPEYQFLYQVGGGGSGQGSFGRLNEFSGTGGLLKP